MKFQYNPLTYRSRVQLIIIFSTFTGNVRWPSQYSDCFTGGTVQGSSPGSSRGLFSSPKHRYRLWGHPASYSMGTAVMFWAKSGRGVKLTIHLHLLQRIRVSGAIPVLSLYVFMAWTRKATYLKNMKNFKSIKLFFVCLFKRRFFVTSDNRLAVNCES